MSSRQIVVVSPEMPHQGITNAGGEYVGLHLQALMQEFDVKLFSPATPGNLSGMHQVVPKDLHVELIKSNAASKRFGPLSAALDKIKWAVLGLSIGTTFEKHLRKSSHFASSVASASLIEFQWTHSGNLWKYVDGLASQTPKILVCHDIYTQLWERNTATAANWHSRLYSRFRGLRAKKAEARIIDRMDAVICFSDKDAALVKELCPTVRVIVLHPPLNAGTRATRQRPSWGKRVLFTGALDAEKNHEAAMWLLEEIWPNVIQQHPDASLVIAGADPREALQEAASKDASVELTGFVADLGQYYADADVFVAPLKRGSGVKFKVITAMLYGLPIIASSVAREGIGEDNMYFGIAQDATAFAAQIVDSLSCPESAAATAQFAQEWAERNYGESSFQANLLDMYNDLTAPAA